MVKSPFAQQGAGVAMGGNNVTNLTANPHSTKCIIIECVLWKMASELTQDHELIYDLFQCTAQKCV